MKILVVDDSPTIRAALRGLLERMGHTVVEANDGKEALQMYRQDRPGLVLIDVVLPIMDGYESARHMRETKADEWVPRGFVSVHDRHHDVDEHEARPVLAVHLQGLLAVARLSHRMTHALEQAPERSADRGGIVDDEDVHQPEAFNRMRTSAARLAALPWRTNRRK